MTAEGLMTTEWREANDNEWHPKGKWRRSQM